MGAAGYLIWKELEARHNLERVKLTKSFQAVAIQQTFGFLRRSLIAACSFGGIIALLYVVSPTGMTEASQMAEMILERISSAR